MGQTTFFVGLSLIIVAAFAYDARFATTAAASPNANEARATCSCPAPHEPELVSVTP